MSEDVLLEIRELREEINNLTANMSRLRYSDFKIMCVEYMRPIVADEGRKVFEKDHSDIELQTTCIMKSECTAKLKTMVDSSLRMFEDGDTQEALNILSAAKELVQCSIHNCQDSECPKRTLEIIQRINSIQQTYLRILDGMEGENYLPISCVSVTEDEVEEYLMPLSNSKRIGILKSLSENPKTLSCLCKEFNMPTGHISFHLNSLKEMEYVSKDPKTKVYTISAKGSVALNGIDSLIQKLKSTVC